MIKRVVQTHSIIVKDCWPNDWKIYPCAPVSASLVAHGLYHVWKPTRKIRLLIMAESPSPTFPEGVIGTKLVDPTGLLPKEIVEAGHVNVVHQLSYGEIELLPEEVRNLLSDTDLSTIRKGTPQFWKFKTALSGMFDVVDGVDPLLNESAMKERLLAIGITKSNKTTLRDRISTKLDILNALKRRGIMLIDSSAHPLFKGFNIDVVNKTTGRTYYTAQNKLPNTNQEMVIKASWKNYTKYLVESYKPDKFVIIGKGVENAIGQDNILEVMNACNIEYLECRLHPSARSLQSTTNYLSQLREYRKLGQECEAAARR